MSKRTHTREDHRQRTEFFEEGERLDANPETRQLAGCWLWGLRIDYTQASGTTTRSTITTRSTTTQSFRTTPTTSATVTSTATASEARVTPSEVSANSCPPGGDQDFFGGT